MGLEEKQNDTSAGWLVVAKRANKQQERTKRQGIFSTK